MSDLSDYVDIRENSDDYGRDMCPECGHIRWLKLDSCDDWRCMECNAERYHDIQHSCGDCGARMLGDGNEWECRVCGRVDKRDTDELIDRMTGTGELRRGYESLPMYPCPVCGLKNLRCFADGEIVCPDCDFYAGQFGDAWYALAEWRNDHDAVEVTCDG
jgi:DNA-directed RNA polymerase subunit RPC12/RpoP